jgi:hypothetical protein
MVGVTGSNPVTSTRIKRPVGMNARGSFALIRAIACALLSVSWPVARVEYRDGSEGDNRQRELQPNYIEEPVASFRFELVSKT